MNEKTQKIIQFRNEGKTYDQIHALIGVSHTTIRKVTKKHADLIFIKDNSIPFVPEEKVAVEQKENLPQTATILKEPKPVIEDSSLLKELQKIKGENELLIKEKRSHDKELQGIIDRDKKKDEQIQSLTHRLNEAMKNAKKIEQSRTEIGNLRDKNDKYLNEIRSLRTKYDKIRDENDKLWEHYENIKSENDDLRLQQKNSIEEYRKLKFKFAKYQAGIILEDMKKEEQIKGRKLSK